MVSPGRRKLPNHLCREKIRNSKERQKESASSLNDPFREEGEITVPDVILSLLSLYLRFTFPANKSQSANTK